MDTGESELMPFDDKPHNAFGWALLIIGGTVFVVSLIQLLKFFGIL